MEDIGPARLEAMLAAAGIGGYDPAGQRLVRRLKEAWIPDETARVPWGEVACGIAVLCRRNRVERLELCCSFLDQDGDGLLTPAELESLLVTISQGAEEARETARLLLRELPEQGEGGAGGIRFHDIAMRGAWHEVLLR